MQELIEQKIEERRKFKDAMPRTIVSPEKTEYCRLFPCRESLLKQLPKGKRIAEIGVSKGDFSKQILQHCEPAKLLLADAWSCTRYGSHKEIVETLFADKIAEGKVELHQGMSCDFLEKLPKGEIDIFYIDTNHDYKNTSQELRLCGEKAAEGAIIMGHDFCTGNIITPVPYGVIEAVNEFCEKYDWGYKYLTVEYHGHLTFGLQEMKYLRQSRLS